MSDLPVPLPELKQLVSEFPAPSSPRGYQPFKEFFLNQFTLHLALQTGLKQAAMTS